MTGRRNRQRSVRRGLIAWFAVLLLFTALSMVTDIPAEGMPLAIAWALAIAFGIVTYTGWV
jgi:hypothetical protein